MPLATLFNVLGLSVILAYKFKKVLQPETQTTCSERVLFREMKALKQILHQ